MAYSLAQIAQKFSLACDGDTTLEPHGLCGLSDDLPDHLSFVADRRLLETAASSKIPAFVTLPGLPVPGKANLFHDSPDYAISKIASLYARPSFTQHEQIARSAVVDESATIAATARIGANVVIGAHTIIGERSTLMAGTAILDRVTLGDDCVIYPNCVVREDSVLGDRVILQPGVAIGGDGFGYTKHDQQHVKTPQLGKVIIESDVEIGANSSIDRARFSATRIGRGTKIDNNVVIAHNVKVGERCIIVAQSAIAGSSSLGDNVVLAGQVGLVGHIKIGDNVTLLAQSLVTKDIREPGVWAGSPARPAKLWRRAIARLYAGVARG